MTEPPHPLAVSLAPLAAAETAAAGPGPAQLQGSFLPPTRPWDGGDSHPLGCCRTPPARPAANPPVPTPCCHSILSAAPRSSLQKSRLGGEVPSHGHGGTGMERGAESTHVLKDPRGQHQLSGCSGLSEPHRAGATVTHPTHAAPRNGQQVPGAWGMLDRLQPALPCHRGVWDAQGGERNPLPASPAPCPGSAQPGSPPARDRRHTASLPSATQRYTTGRGDPPPRPPSPPPSPGHVLL